MGWRHLWATVAAVGAAGVARCEPRSQCVSAPEGDSCLVESVSLHGGTLFSNCSGRLHLCSKPQRDVRMCPPATMLSPHEIPAHASTTVHRGTYFFVQRLVPFNRMHTALGDILGMRNVLHQFGQPQLDGIIIFDSPAFQSSAMSDASLNCAKMFVDFFKCNVTYAADLDSSSTVHEFERVFMGIGGHDFMYVGPDCVSPGDFVAYRAEWYRAVGLAGADMSLPVGLQGWSRHSRHNFESERLSKTPLARDWKRTPSERASCRAAFIDNKRKFSNHDEMVLALNSTLTSLRCPLTMIDWKDSPTMAEELGLMRNINVYITSVGTGALNAMFLRRGSVVVNLGWLDDDPSSVYFNAPLGGYHDAFAFPALPDIRTLYYPLPILHTINTTVLEAVVSDAVQVFRSGFAVPVLKVNNQDPWGQACAVLFKAEKDTHREMLTNLYTHYCEQYLGKYRNITTLDQLAKMIATN